MLQQNPSSAVALRSARREDLPGVAALNRTATPGVTALSPVDLETCLGQATRFRVAEAGGVLLGYLLAYSSDASYDGEEFRWFRGAFPHFVYVDQIAVDQSSRGTGIGTAFYRDLADWALRRGLDRLVCEVNLEPANPGSERFHDRMGFTEVDQMRTGDGRRVALLSRLLEPAP